jgi:hypothetical protein
MRKVLHRSIFFFTLVTSFNVIGDGKETNCRSWWSKLNGIHHCLLTTDNGGSAGTLIQDEISDTHTKSEELYTDDISIPKESQQLQGPPPGLQVMDIPEK